MSDLQNSKNISPWQILLLKGKCEEMAGTQMGRINTFLVHVCQRPQLDYVKLKFILSLL